MKRKAVKTFSLFLAIVLISISLAPVALANNKIDEARSSIVRVVTETGTGTAFVVAQSGQTTTLVSNLHVVGGASQVIILTDDISGSWIPVTQIIYFPDGLDLVLLVTTSGLANRPALPLARAETVRAAQSVYALGFPGAADVVRDNWDMLPSGTNDVTVNRGVISNPTIVMDNGVNSMHSDVSITYGNSGGPLLNEKGEVIGVNTWGYSEDAWGASYSIHIDYVIDECIARGIPYVPASRGFLFDNLLLIVIIGSVIVLGTIVLVVVTGKKKKPAAAGGYAHGVPVHGAPGPAPGYQVPVAAPVAHAPGVRAYIRGTNGIFAGKRFEVGNKIIIGRDSSKCAVAFPLDAAGISGIHCEVTFDGSVAYLRDLGSSYGTFMASGQKLEAKVPLRLTNGERFYVGSADNTFEFGI